MLVMDRNARSGNAVSDDLPRTLRREREARERTGGTGSGSGISGFGAPSHSASQPAYAPEPGMSEHVMVSGNTVTDIRIPFFRMTMFCFKLVFAAIPALILLGCFIWLAGHALMTYAPWLVKLQILIRVPN